MRDLDKAAGDEPAALVEAEAAEVEQRGPHPRRRFLLMTLIEVVESRSRDSCPACGASFSCPACGASYLYKSTGVEIQSSRSPPV